MKTVQHMEQVNLRKYRVTSVEDALVVLEEAGESMVWQLCVCGCPCSPSSSLCLCRRWTPAASPVARPPWIVALVTRREGDRPSHSASVARKMPCTSL